MKYVAGDLFRNPFFDAATVVDPVSHDKSAAEGRETGRLCFRRDAT